jgi:hypothetical protein
MFGDCFGVTQYAYAQYAQSFFYDMYPETDSLKETGV